MAQSSSDWILHYGCSNHLIVGVVGFAVSSTFEHAKGLNRRKVDDNCLCIENDGDATATFQEFIKDEITLQKLRAQEAYLRKERKEKR